MTDHWLIFDAPYMCYRAFFSTGGLSYKEGPTGVIYGVLKSIQLLQNKFCTDKVIFAFDHGRSWRKVIYPDYKKNRRQNMTPEQEQAFEGLKIQINLLKYRYLYQIGYRNIFFQKGFEADDIIAAVPVIHNLNATIVSADKDLFQCITETPCVTVYNPYKDEVMNCKAFRKTYGILPSQWATVKAIAGCRTDNVPGVKGVADKTAIKYLQNQLGGQKANAINTQKSNIARTMELVRLPFDDGEHSLDLSKLQLANDCVTMKQWNEVVGSLGMKSLKDALEPS